MKISTREDFEAPVDFVFGAITDFDAFERKALRRGAEVVRSDPGQAPDVGSTWDIRFPFRGKNRFITSELTRFERPDGFSALSVSGGVEGNVTVELISLSPRRTRMQIGIDLRPKSLSARLLLQSLKFAKSSVDARISKRIWAYARDVESDYRASA